MGGARSGKPLVGLRKPINRQVTFCRRAYLLPRPKPHHEFGLLDPPYQTVHSIYVGATAGLPSSVLHAPRDKPAVAPFTLLPWAVRGLNSPRGRRESA